MDLDRIKKLAGLQPLSEKAKKEAKEAKEKKPESKVEDGEDAKKVVDDITNATNMDESADIPTPAVSTEAGLPTNVDNTADMFKQTAPSNEQAVKVQVPKDVTEQTNKRIAELKASIANYDEKGYDDHSMKQHALDAMDQIMRNLSSGDEEGRRQAQMFYNTLMSPITDLLPPKLILFLAHGPNPKREGTPVEIK